MAGRQQPQRQPPQQQQPHYLRGARGRGGLPPLLPGLQLAGGRTLRGHPPAPPLRMATRQQMPRSGGGCCWRTFGQLCPSLRRHCWLRRCWPPPQQRRQRQQQGQGQGQGERHPALMLWGSVRLRQPWATSPPTGRSCRCFCCWRLCGAWRQLQQQTAALQAALLRWRPQLRVPRTCVGFAACCQRPEPSSNLLAASGRPARICCGSCLQQLCRRMLVQASRPPGRRCRAAAAAAAGPALVLAVRRRRCSRRLACWWQQPRPALLLAVQLLLPQPAAWRALLPQRQQLQRRWARARGSRGSRGRGKNQPRQQQRRQEEPAQRLSWQLPPPSSKPCCCGWD